MTSGIHHVTLITRRVQDNVDFYAGFLGLRLAKRTAGFEDATQLHLFYGDSIASPGSLVTFLVWEDGSPGRVGHGAPSEIALAIAPEAIGFWLTRALQFGIKLSGPAAEFGEPVLRLTDPDGVIVKLVGVPDTGHANPWTGAGVPEEFAIRGLRGATILSEKPVETVAFLESHMGFAPGSESGGMRRLTSEAGEIIDVRNASGFWTAAPGTGTIDHIAFRATDRAEVERVRDGLPAAERLLANVHDRTYFYSLYVREPGGTLLELATDGPGFAIDEPIDSLGTKLFIPPHIRGEDTDIKTMLPQFALPGEMRMPHRDLPFVHRIHQPENPDGTTLILLHGTGGNEASLMPYASRMAPNATLIGVRGRSSEEGVARFFRRLSMVTFDQKDIASEADAFAAFIDGAREAYDIDPARTAFLGYSNGANMLGAMMLLHPGLVNNAILLRAMNVLEQPPAVDLTGTRALMISGAHDPYGVHAPELQTQLEKAHATLTSHVISAGHEIGMPDVQMAADWLATLKL
ncbi:ring-cleaving dioxygenase [Rhizobium sp. CG5]|uniref:VOC family protein n=1 Tax=Rhizobium sp. CG5 TaxID=2726076 RepID=UPI0020333D1E|nr:VOC family protein [Rhizobium sp. CG5]MCM2474284.1 ring-cleaving dioxygenase [Rhizobium sp. CG5]